jgi:hypothetical protein
MKREYCGVFGIYNHAEAARMTAGRKVRAL